MMKNTLEHIRARIAQAASRAGREADQITLIAVSKTQPAAGISIFWACLV